MKKKISLLMAVLAISAIVCGPAKAQNTTSNDEMLRHEIGISYGTVPNSAWIDLLTDIIPAMFGETHKNKHYVGPIGLEYYYHFTPLIGVGGTVVFATNNNDGFYKEDLISHYNKSYFTVMPSAKFNWLRKEKWGLYSKVAIGGTLATISFQDYDIDDQKSDEKATTKDLVFNFQASLLGVEAGGRNVRGFAEFGIGEQGIILGGVRYKF